MQYDKEFKLQALELSDDIGVKKAAEQLGIPFRTVFLLQHTEDCSKRIFSVLLRLSETLWV